MQCLFYVNVYAKKAQAVHRLYLFLNKISSKSILRFFFIIFVVFYCCIHGLKCEQEHLITSMAFLPYTPVSTSNHRPPASSSAPYGAPGTGKRSPAPSQTASDDLSSVLPPRLSFLPSFPPIREMTPADPSSYSSIPSGRSHGS